MTSVGIIGSGFGALAVTIELTQAGHTDLRLWERSHDLGGVWRDNTYPGAGCDVPSPLYPLSYEPNPHWTRRYAVQVEIHAYIRAVADQRGITPLVRFGSEVVAASWDEGSSTWTVTLADPSSASGTRDETVDILVSTVGQLSRPPLPRIGGVSFAGPSFHSAQWDHSFDPADKTIAVVGAGASAVQFIPHLARDARRLRVFQRQTIDRPEAGSYSSVEVTEEAELAYDRRISAHLEHSAWAHCDNWYRHRSGRITSNWPGGTAPFAMATKVLEPAAFRSS